MGERPSVAVVGVGAIGGFFAAQLVAAETADVVLCVRRPFDELVLETGGEELRSKPAVCTDPTSVAPPRPGTMAGPIGTEDRSPDAIVGPVDWVLLATKAHQTAGAAPWLDALVGPDTRVVILQNGVEHVERVRPFLAEDAELIPAVVYCGSEVLAPGRIIHRSNGFLIVPASRAADELTELFAPARAGIRTSDDFTTTAWQKLCANVVANGITALTAQRVGVMRRPDLLELGRGLVDECVEVGRAEGADIDDGYADLLLRGVQDMPAEGGTSMLYDRLAGNALEHDALYGAVVRVGRRHRIATPLHQAFVALLGAISDASSTSGPRSDPSGG
jgi:2-dehydropantoate 2-reductase